MTPRTSRLVVVGSGIAGLYGTLVAVAAGWQVTLVTKGHLRDSNTSVAQGGMCAVLPEDPSGPPDSVAAHELDTLISGAWQGDAAAVAVLCAAAAADVAALERFGVVFDRDPQTGGLARGLEGAHSAARILHAGGDATGAVISAALIRAVRTAAATGAVELREHVCVTDLLLADGRVRGVRGLAPGADGTLGSEDICGDAVLLASGGAGQLFRHTTNPAVATADGVAAAWRAGARLADLEYFQFHPTALTGGESFLISEAVRGAGAVLRDGHGTAFMRHYDPAGDLASRDVVSRTIATHLQALAEVLVDAPAEALAATPEGVFLDATDLERRHGAGYLARRFPTIDARTRELGFDWRRDWLPVAPAAHYWMGGVATDRAGRTSLPGLFAAGEVACTGVHGANRLASNSLLEGLVFSRRAVEALVDDGAAPPASTVPTPALSRRPVAGLGASAAPLHSAAPVEPFTREALQALMSAHAGVVRDAAGLALAARQLACWREQLPAPGAGSAAASRTVAAVELENLLTAAELLVAAASQHTGSVGAHWRSDHPAPSPEAPQLPPRQPVLAGAASGAPHPTPSSPDPESEAS